MPRISELTLEQSAADVQEVMRQQEERFGAVLNPTKLMGYCPTILQGAGALTMGIERAGNIEASLRCLVYTYVAWLNGCPFWVDINASRGMREGLSEDQIGEIEQYASSSKFSQRENLALTYAERITRTDQDVDADLFVSLREEFSDAAIVELTATVAFENFRSKFNHALLIESNGFCVLNKERE